jgi:hypothetical protein
MLMEFRFAGATKYGVEVKWILNAENNYYELHDGKKNT